MVGEDIQQLLTYAYRRIKCLRAEVSDLRKEVYRLARVNRTQTSVIETLKRQATVDHRSRAERIFKK